MVLDWSLVGNDAASGMQKSSLGISGHPRIHASNFRAPHATTSSRLGIIFRRFPKVDPWNRERVNHWALGHNLFEIEEGEQRNPTMILKGTKFCSDESQKPMGMKNSGWTAFVPPRV
jgi:hypothetical protein